MTAAPLRVRELFDPDDVVAQWVFALSATVTDLATAESVFRDALENSTAVRTGYLYRQLIARLYEAERVVTAIDQQAPVRAFLGALVTAGPSVEFLRDHYLPVEQSRVRT